MLKGSDTTMKTNKNFLQDNHASATALLVILLIGILSSAVIIYYSIHTPEMNEEAELVHMGVVYGDMRDLKTDIYDVARYVIPKSSSIHLGAAYPREKFSLAPAIGGASGSLAVTSELPIVINYTDPVGFKYSQSYNTSSIIYTLQGTLVTPKLVYEHGVIISDFGTMNTSLYNQTLIVGDEIVIPITHGTEGSISSREIESFEIYPCVRTEKIDRIQYVDVMLDTNYPEVWRELLKNVNTTNTTAYVSADNKIKIESNATQVMILPVMKNSTDFYFLCGCRAELLTYLYQDKYISGIASGIGEFYLNKKNPFWVNMPSSSDIQEFLITDIGFKKAQDAKIEFEVYDHWDNMTKWECSLEFGKQNDRVFIQKVKMVIKDGPEYVKSGLNLTYDPEVGINLLHLDLQYPDPPEKLLEPDQYNAAKYSEAMLGDVNYLKVKKTDEMLYVAFRIL